MASIAPPRFYVYVLCRPNGKPFYVGKGKGKRLFDHDREARKGCSCKKCNTIRKIWRNDGTIQYYVVFETDDEQAAFDYERVTIALHGRQNLTNMSDGGLGLNGYSPSTKTRKLLARLNQKDPAPCTHCGRLYKPLRRGLCAACSQYRRIHGTDRPLDLAEKLADSTPPETPEGMKWCSACREIKLISGFYVDRGRPHSLCKVCHKQRITDRYFADIEKSHERNRVKYERTKQREGQK